MVSKWHAQVTTDGHAIWFVVVFVPQLCVFKDMNIGGSQAEGKARPRITSLLTRGLMSTFDQYSMDRESTWDERSSVCYSKYVCTLSGGQSDAECETKEGGVEGEMESEMESEMEGECPV